MSLGVCLKSEPSGTMMTEWSYLLSHFGVADIWERDEKQSPLMESLKIDFASDLPVEPSLIVLQPLAGRFIQGDEDLYTFTHPDDAIYFFGGGHANMSDDEDLNGVIPTSKVYIPNVSFELHPPQCAAIVLWDRYCKRGGFG